GHPEPPDTAATAADHSCPDSHSQRTLRPERTVTASAARSLPGCHSAATSGRWDARSLNPASTFCPAQYGQRDPFDTDARAASHRCPHGPSHSAVIRVEEASTAVGSAVFSAAHRASTAGRVVARPLNPASTFRFEQYGHSPLPARRSRTAAVHSCPYSSRHLLVFRVSGAAASGSGLSGCHSRERFVFMGRTLQQITVVCKASGDLL